MIDLRDITPLTDFQRRTKAHIRKLKSTGRPSVLTVNGKAEVVVVGAAAFQKLLESIDRAEAIVGIRAGGARRRGDRCVYRCA